VLFIELHRERFGVEPMCRVLCEHDVHIEDSDRDISESRWHRKVANTVDSNGKPP
jgi:hypothetical protein